MMNEIDQHFAIKIYRKSTLRKKAQSSVKAAYIGQTEKE
jgi:hypothetical protein